MGGEVQLFEFVHRLGRGLNNVQQTLVRALLEGFLGFFIRVRRAQNGKTLNARGKWNGAYHPRAGALDRFHNVAGRLVDDAMVIGLQSNANTLSCHIKRTSLTV